jgi:hypothetical protein
MTELMVECIMSKIQIRFFFVNSCDIFKIEFQIERIKTIKTIKTKN